MPAGFVQKTVPSIFRLCEKYALEILKKQDDKLSLKRRRKKCGRNIDYLLKVFKEC